MAIDAQNHLLGGVGAFVCLVICIPFAGEGLGCMATLLFSLGVIQSGLNYVCNYY